MNKDNITLDELFLKKLALEAAIENLLKTFQEETGLIVDAIELDNDILVLKGDVFATVQRVNIDIKL
jgi:hypothetical protein